MGKRATLMLAVVVLALLAYILKFERTSLTSKELDQREGKVLTRFVREKVSRVEIQRKGKRVVLERTPESEGGFGAWRMLEPWQVEADEGEIDGVLGELEWLAARRTLSDLSDKDRAQFGLDKPRYRVTFRAGDATQRLSLGLGDVHGEGVYAAVDDDATGYVIPKTLLEALDHDPGHYRSKEFLGEMVTAWARKLSIETPEGRVELEKKDGRFWVMGALSTYADGKAIDVLLRGLNDLKATRFLQEQEAERALLDLQKAKRKIELRIVPDEGREDRTPQLVELWIGGACEGHADEQLAMAGPKGAPVCVGSDELKRFEPGPLGFAQAQLVSANPGSIERFELTAANNKIALKREGQEWTANAANNKPDREAVEQWLEDLGREQAQSFEKLGPFEERARLVLELAEDRRETLSVGPVLPDGGVLVRRDQEPALVRFGGRVADLLTPAARRFASLDLWSHQPSEVQVIEAQSGPLSRKLMLDAGAWRTAPKAPEVADSVRVRELLRELVRLRALSFVTERSRNEHGFATPSARLTLSVGAEGTPRRELKLELGSATDRGAYARIEDGAVYEVPVEVVNLIDELAGGQRKAQPASAEPSEAEPEDDEHGHEHEHE